MKEQRRRLLMKKLVCIGLSVACLLSLLPALAGEGEIFFVSGGQEIRTALPFSDEYFSGSGREFRQDLALSSIGMATSAFRKPKAEPEKRSEPIETYLKQLGFQDISLEEYAVEPNITTIATAIASKTIEPRLGESYTLLAVAISGGGYKDEWKSNFSIGTEETHEGFDHAARQVLERIKTYMQRFKATDKPFKLWMSGYSRAAATANRTAALLLDEGLLPADRLYAYTFATPNVTTKENATSYPSIFNVVGAFDPVPMVPFASWGFKRFGQTFYLPAPETNSDYGLRVEPVNRIHKQLSGSDYWKSASSDQVVGKLLSVLSNTMKGNRDYAKKLQPLLIQLWDSKQSPAKLLKVGITSLFRNKNPLKGFFGQTWTIAANALGLGIMQQSGVLPNEWKEGKSLTDNLAHEHMPLGYLAWMMAYPKAEALYSRNQNYVQVSFRWMSKLQIKDGEGHLVLDYPLAAYGDQNPSTLPLFQVGDDPAVILPGDQPYAMTFVPLQGSAACLMLSNGRAGSTQVSRYKTAENTLDDKTTYHLSFSKQEELSCPVIQAEDGRQLPLKVDTDLASLSEDERNSSVKGYMSQNLVVVVAVIIGLLLQILFYFTILIRAVRRRRVLLRLQKDGKDIGPKRLRLTQDGRKQPLLYLVGAVLLLVSIGIFANAAYASVQLLRQLQGMQQMLMFWYFTLYSLPVIVMMLFAGIPGFFSALFFVGRAQNVHRLKTVRFYCVFSLAFTALMLGVLLTGLYSDQYSLLKTMGFMQTVLLVLVLSVVSQVLHREKRAGTDHIRRTDNA